ncbi:hypothetical protein H0H93_010002 [Arthromyces matolae]|nr:hypothetical protein H0H93_010002 [Arthromyces matolae]
MAHLTPLFINGQPKNSGRVFDVFNPASGSVVGTSANASSEDCQEAVAAAVKAFETWEKSTIAERRSILLKAADLAASDAYKQKVIEAIQTETAASDAWSLFDWRVTSNLLRTSAGFLGELKGAILPSAFPDTKVEVHRRALGVVFSIAPWNAPIVLSLRAVLLPILCGNTVVLKSSEYTPRTQAIVFELLHEAGLPRGVLNYISVSREDAPARTSELIAHPAIRKITFTGSDRVGRIIASEAGKNLKPCVLELGGKAPVIVLDDANVAAAAQGIVTGGFSHSGQVCMSSERVIVQAGIAPLLIDSIIILCKGLEGNIGPLFTEGSAENVINMTKEAVENGAELLLGDLNRERAVVQPHLLKLPFKGSDTGKGLRAWEKESFGPVLVFVVINTVNEAVELANASDYSLTAGVWSSDVYAAQQVAARVRAGMVSVLFFVYQQALDLDSLLSIQDLLISMVRRFIQNLLQVHEDWGSYQNFNLIITILTIADVEEVLATEGLTWTPSLISGWL